MSEFKIFPVGDSALTIEFANQISVEINERVLKLAQKIEQEKFVGLIETVPAYGSLTVFYNLATVRKNYARFETAFAFVKYFLENLLLEAQEITFEKPRLVRVPICFDPEFAPDLQTIATEHNLTSEKVCKIFLARIYRVFMLGFLPGFVYMGEVDQLIATPRKTTPRLEVPMGSVGIAGKQTGIYSLKSPGGWQIIGRTPLCLFDPENKPPVYFQPGDAVQFYKIDIDEFHQLTKA